MPKNKPTITAHCLVKNEEVYVKAAVMSVIDYVDKIIIFDAGSTDNTIPILEKLSRNKKYIKKIHFEVRGDADKTRHTELRNEMIKLTNTDWFMVLDGDEVWPKDQIKFVVENDLEAADSLGRPVIFANFHLCSLDIYHYTESGHYGTDWGLHGHLTPRFVKNIGIYFGGEYSKDTLVNRDGNKVLNQTNVYLTTAYFWHLSKLYRSSVKNPRIAGIKPTKQKLIPKFLRRYFVKKTSTSLPETILK